MAGVTSVIRTLPAGESVLSGHLEMSTSLREYATLTREYHPLFPPLNLLISTIIAGPTRSVCAGRSWYKIRVKTPSVLGSWRESAVQSNPDQPLRRQAITVTSMKFNDNL